MHIPVRQSFQSHPPETLNSNFSPDEKQVIRWANNKKSFTTDQAAKHIPLEQLGIGPQCGFSSGGGSGQAVTQDDTRRKLELVMEVAHDVWG